MRFNAAVLERAETISKEMNDDQKVEVVSVCCKLRGQWKRMSAVMDATELNRFDASAAVLAFDLCLF